MAVDTRISPNPNLSVSRFDRPGHGHARTDRNGAITTLDPARVRVITDGDLAVSGVHRPDHGAGTDPDIAVSRAHTASPNTRTHNHLTVAGFDVLDFSVVFNGDGSISGFDAAVHSGAGFDSNGVIARIDTAIEGFTGVDHNGPRKHAGRDQARGSQKTQASGEGPFRDGVGQRVDPVIDFRHLAQLQRQIRRVVEYELY